jgi:nucleoside phosphorylase
MPILANWFGKKKNTVHGRLGTATIALLTITTEEFETVRNVFDLGEELVGSAYAVHHLNRMNDYNLVLRRAPGQTNVISTHLASAVLEDFRPSYLFIIGTAGGHSDREGIKLGDVVVADYIDYSAYWKLKEGSYEERKNACDHPSLHLLENFAEGLRRNPDHWIRQLRMKRPDDSVPKVHVGGVVAGELLLGDAENAEQQRILKNYKKALAFEMESFGIARTVYRFRSSVHYTPQFLIVRGISDLVDRDATMNQEQRKIWTPLAVEAAATFTKVLIKRLLDREANNSGFLRRA